MTAPEYINENVAEAVAVQLGNEIDPAQVVRVLSALNAVTSGEPIGTVRRDPATGDVAHRILLNGVGQWRVSTSSDMHYHMAPSLPDWDVLYTPAEQE